MMEQVNVKILERDYRLSCEPAEREQLLASVAHVDATMRAIRDQGRIAGAERIAVFAALNIASDLLSRPASGAGAESIVESTVKTKPMTPKTEVADEEIVRRMRSINALLDTALVDQERLF